MSVWKAAKFVVIHLKKKKKGHSDLVEEIGTPFLNPRNIKKFYDYIFKAPHPLT